MESDEIGDLAGRTSLLEVRDGSSHAPHFMNYNEEPPPAPQIHSEGVVATDITGYFTKATEKLDVGQLIKDEFFTLFESVGAIEIMDPKMDTGFLAAGETMDDDYDVEKPLLPEEVLGIIDQLLCLEMAWHLGHPLSQTIFTSLYIEALLNSKTDKLDSVNFGQGGFGGVADPLTLRCLRAYCLGLVKTCCFVNNRVKSEHFYEEEDFVTHTYNRSLLDDIDEQPILKCLEEISLEISSLKSTPLEIRDALQGRLDFRIAFLRTVAIADNRDAQLLKELWSGMLARLPGVAESKSLAKSVPDSFSVKLQRKLASSVPPRPVVIVEFSNAYGHLERLCRDGQILTEVLEYHDSQSLMTFVALFQTRKPQPSVYIRTLLQYYLFGDMVVLGTMSIRHLIDDDLSVLVLPEDQLLDPGNDEIEVPHDPRFNMSKRMEVFRSRAAQTYLDMLRTFCQNRCRLRRNLNHTIVEWDNLQLDSEELDSELREFTNETHIIDQSIGPDPIFAFPLSSWAYFYKLRQMEWIVQMGFELEVYQADELASMYWYLQHLTSTRVRHLERIRIFVLRKLAAADISRAPQALKEHGFVRALSFINFSMLEATATQGFADALSCFFVVLARLSLLTSPPRPYSDDATRYELRMKPFLQIGLPESLAYVDFDLQVTQPQESTADLMKFSAAAVARARKDFELISKLDGKTGRYIGSEESWKKNMKDCLKSCISASIGISMVQKAIERVGEKGDLGLRAEVVEVEKGYHDWWIIPKITPKAR